MNIAGADFEICPALELPEEEVHLWRANLDAIRGDESRWRAVLSSEELNRAARFHFVPDRQRFIAARALLRTILAAYLTVDSQTTDSHTTNPKDLVFMYSQKQKPSLGSPHAASGIAFNISHSGGLALLAFTRKREIGVDVELLRNDVEVESIAARFFSTHEQQQIAAVPEKQKCESFFRCWTRKEAYIKATGDGLSLPLHQFDVSVLPETGDALLATRPDPSDAAAWSLREVPAGPGYVAALCVRGHEWRLNDWTEVQA